MKTFLTLSLACLMLSLVAFGQTTGTGTTKLTADLNPANLVPPLTDGTGSATADIEVTLISGGGTGSDSALVNFEITLDGLTAADITGLSLNQGAEGLNGQPLVTQTFGTGGEPPTGSTLTGQVMVQGSANLEALQAVLESPEDYYIVLTTSTNPAGALRGQLVAGDGNGGVDDLNTKVDKIQTQLNVIQTMLRTIGISIGIPPEQLPEVPESTDDGSGTDTGSGTTTQ
jgi:hypothetical protein